MRSLVSVNPSQSDFHFMMEGNPRAKITNKGNYSIETQVTARSSESTFFVCDESMGKPSISRTEYEKSGCHAG